MKRIFAFVNVLLYVVIGLSSCQSEIEVKLPNYEPKLVVEGYIENGQVARVMLSRSLPYFETIDLNYIVQNVLVMDAVVTITSSDGETERLNLTLDEESPLYYSYKGHILGKENTAYSLKIEWGGQVYTANTTIPHTFELDSIGFYKDAEVLEDTMRSIRVLMTDDPSENNYYQYMVKVHGKKLHDRLWVSTLPVAFDDATFSGLTFNFEVLRANPSAFLLPEMSEEELKEYYRVTYRPGDTVYVKHSLMDYDSYQFWNTGGYSAAMGQNPFMNPAPVISNIQGNNVTGVWCGLASKIDVLIYEESELDPSFKR